MPARLLRREVRVPNRVEQCRLPMIDVSEDRNDRGSRRPVPWPVHPGLPRRDGAGATRRPLRSAAPLPLALAPFPLASRSRLRRLGRRLAIEVDDEGVLLLLDGVGGLHPGHPHLLELRDQVLARNAQFVSDLVDPLPRQECPSFRVLKTTTAAQTIRDGPRSVKRKAHQAGLRAVAEGAVRARGHAGRADAAACSSSHALTFWMSIHVRYFGLPFSFDG